MMVSLIKNQILKQLSKFAKNLSPDKVQLSTLKGHCELHNLELDELVLTEVLELPMWLRITRAICNNVMIKIHWTKLKSVPIHLSLDEVLVETEVCEDLRTLSSQPTKQTYRGGGKYGFSDRVVDGMSIVVNSVIISFQSPVFQASIQISRLLLESRTPNWKKADLRLSRIKNAERGEILFFKQLDWQVLRIEAKARPKADGSNTHLTPLRLITNQASCKIAIKKKLADCSVAGCRIVLVLDDLLWVLTDAQLVAALHFLNSLSELVQQASEVSKKIKAKRKLEQQPDKHSSHASHPSKSSSSNQRPSSIIRYFNHYDIIETSYHIYCGRIDLHLCDDMDPISGESRKSNINSGSSLQLSFIKLSADYYPYHRAFGSREHWLRYSEPSSGRSAWVQQLMSLFLENIPAKFQQEAFFGTENTTSKSSGSKHTSVHRAPPHGNMISNFMDYQQTEKPASGKGNADSNGGRRASITQYKKAAPQWSLKYLMSSCFIFRLEDYSVYKVSNSTTSKKYAQEKFLASDKASLLLPADMKSVHLEMTSYYFPGDVTLPVPTPNIYLHSGPLQLTYDEGTIIWLNTFMLNLFKCIQMARNAPSPAVQSFLLSLNIRVEALMPQIVIPADKCYPTNPERPKKLHLQASRIVATNCRIGDHASHLHLNQCLESLSHGGMFFDMSSYPWMKGDFKPIAEKFVEQMIGKHNVDGKKQPVDTGHDSLVEGHDIWSVHLDPCWADFTFSKSVRSRPQTFVDPSPITLWFFVKAVEEALKSGVNSPTDVNQNGTLCNGSDTEEGSYKKTSVKSEEESGAREADIYVLVHVHSLLNVQLTHYQYLFLLRVLDSITALSAQLAEDASAIVEQSDVPNICITSWWPQIELALLLPSLNQNSPKSDSGESLQADSSVCDDLVPKRKTLSSTYSSFSLGDCDIHTKGFNSRKPDGTTVVTLESSSIPKSHSDLLLNSHSSSSSPPVSPPPLTVAEPTTEKSTDHIHKSIHTGTSAMKRGFCNLMASIDSVLTKNETGEVDNTSHCEDDTMSVQSDFSSDSDQFVLVGLESSLVDDDPFHFHSLPEPEVEEAAEVKEDSPSVRSISGSEKKEAISVLTLKLSGIEVVAQLSEFNNNILVKCHCIDTNEKVQTSVEEFQTAFSARSRGWQADKTSDGPPSEFQLSLRYSKCLAPDNIKSASSEELLSLSVTDINLSMLTSSLSGVMDLLKDEISPEPVPTQVVINNLNLLLQDNISLAAEVPVHFHLPGCLIERTRDGHVRLLPLPSGYLKSEVYLHASFNKSLPKVSSDICDVKNSIVGTNYLDSIRTSTNSIDEDVSKGYGQEFEKIRKKLSIFQDLQRENELLKQELQSLRNARNDSILREQLVEAREEVRKLEEGKESLLAKIKVLQEELKRQKY